MSGRKTFSAQWETRKKRRLSQRQNDRLNQGKKKAEDETLYTILTVIYIISLLFQTQAFEQYYESTTSFTKVLKKSIKLHH